MIDLALLLAHGDHHHAFGHGHGHDHSWLAGVPLLAGLIAGAAHVVTGPDHIAAVAPLAMKHRRRSWMAGLTWGLGHSGGMVLLAAVALLAREALPVEAVSAWSERLVGITLVAIGLWGLHGVMRLHVHTHRHEHVGKDGTPHVHEHVHVHARPIGAGRDALHEHAAQDAHGHGHGLLGIGALHGVAGTAHLVSLLPALALERTAAMLYVLGVCLGSMLGMGLFTGALGLLMQAADRVGALLSRGLMATSSIAAVVIGSFWVGRTFSG